MLDDLELSGDDAGWAHLGTFGSYLTKLQPGASPLFRHRTSDVFLGHAQC